MPPRAFCARERSGGLRPDDGSRSTLEQETREDGMAPAKSGSLTIAFVLITNAPNAIVLGAVGRREQSALTTRRQNKMRAIVVMYYYT